MRWPIGCILIVLMSATGCSNSVEGQLIQIDSVQKLDDGWRFRLTPNSKGMKLLEKNIHYSIDVGDPAYAISVDTKGCSIVSDRRIFAVAEGVNVAYQVSGSHVQIWFDGEQILACNRQGQAKCLEVYSTVRLQGGESNIFVDYVDQELIDPLILEFCDGQTPKVQL